MVRHSWNTTLLDNVTISFEESSECSISGPCLKYSAATSSVYFCLKLLSSF